jgi:hypothetical protein
VKLLLHGIDTLQCAYFLHSVEQQGIDFGHLAEQKESIRQSKNKNPLPITLGNSGYLLHPYGSDSGFPLIISNEDFKIEMGELNKPNFYVTFRSQALWRESAFLLHDKFLKWAASTPASSAHSPHYPCQSPVLLPRPSQRGVVQDR